MAHSLLTLEETSGELLNWTKALLFEVENRLPEIHGILGKSNGAMISSRKQQSLLVFQGVKENLSEVATMVDEVEEAIRTSE